MTAAPPKPCTMRATTSAGSECESAQASDPSVKSAMPQAYTPR